MKKSVFKHHVEKVSNREGFINMTRAELLTKCNYWRTCGIYGLILLSKCDFRKQIIDEMMHWKKHLNFGGSRFYVFSYLLIHYKEYRNLLRHRFSQRRNVFLKIISEILLVTLKKESKLYLTTSNIGKNLFIQHGFSTVVSACSIGDNCWINQQVTIGYSFDDMPPTIGNGVAICAGAKVLGGITIGDNAIIGANAVVVKDVGENEIVAGVPAKVIGINHDHKLYP